jgi:hypothetical protein
MGKVVSKCGLHISESFNTLLKVNNHPLGESSPDLVALLVYLYVPTNQLDSEENKKNVPVEKSSVEKILNTKFGYSNGLCIASLNLFRKT